MLKRIKGYKNAAKRTAAQFNKRQTEITRLVAGKMRL